MEPMHLGSPGSPPAPSSDVTATSPYLPAYLLGDSTPGPVSKVKPTSPTKQPKHVSFGGSPTKFVLSPEARSYSFRSSGVAPAEKPSGPPIRSLYDSFDDSFASPTPAVKSPDRCHREIHVNVLNSSQNKSLQPSEDNWLTVFGFPPSSMQFIASLFGSCGLIVDKRIPQKGNWMHIRYQSGHEARKALNYNGKIFAGSIMIGVIPCQDPEVMKDSSHMKENILETSYLSKNVSGMTTPPPSRPDVLNQSTPSNFSYLGSPVRIGNVRPLNQMYRPGQNEQTHPQGAVPQRSTSMVTKAMEYVFGW